MHLFYEAVDPSKFEGENINFCSQIYFGEPSTQAFLEEAPKENTIIGKQFLLNQGIDPILALTAKLDYIHHNLVKYPVKHGFTERSN